MAARRWRAEPDQLPSFEAAAAAAAATGRSHNRGAGLAAKSGRDCSTFAQHSGFPRAAGAELAEHDGGPESGAAAARAAAGAAAAVALAGAHAAAAVAVVGAAAAGGSRDSRSGIGHWTWFSSGDDTSGCTIVCPAPCTTTPAGASPCVVPMGLEMGVKSTSIWTAPWRPTTAFA